MNRAHLFLVRNYTDGTPPTSTNLRAFGPPECRIPLILPSELSYEERFLRAHRIAAEVRQRRGMVVMKHQMATWK